MERVSHAIRPVPGERELRAYGAGFLAAYDERGLRLTPATPGAARAAFADDAGFRFYSEGVEVAGRPVSESAPDWWVRGNTAQALLSSSAGIVEHHLVGDDGVFVSWVIRQRPRGDVVIDLATEGLTFFDRVGDALRLADESGTPRVRIGGAELVDAAGVRTPIASEATDTGVRYRVEGALLARAAFPVVLDPLIGPEVDVSSDSIEEAPGNQAEVTIAWGGTEYLVVWRDYRSAGAEIMGARVTALGELLDYGGIQIGVAGTNYWDTSDVAFDGTNYLAVWARDGNIYGRFIAAGTGVPLGGQFSICTQAAQQALPSVASNGSGYLVAWEDSRGTGVQTWGALVSEAGAVAGGAAAGGFAMDDFRFLGKPDIAFNGSNYLVVMGNYGYGDLRARTVASDGSLSAYISVAVTPDHREVGHSVVASGNEYVVVWWQNRIDTGADEAIMARKLDGSGALLGQAIPIASIDNSTQTAITWNGTFYLIAWWDDADQILARRLTENGVSVDAAPILVATGGGLDLAAASDGTDFQIAFRDATEGGAAIYGTRVQGSDGSVLDDPPTLLTGARRNVLLPDIASLASGESLLVWLDYRGGAQSAYGVLLSATGAVLTPAGILIADGLLYGASYNPPKVASNGSSFLVVWATELEDIAGRRITGDGTMDAVVTLSSSPSFEYNADVASNGSDYQVVWTSLEAGGNFEIYGRAVSSAGVPQGAGRIVVAGGAGNQDAPAIAWNGGHFLVAWQDSEGGAPNVLGRRLSSTGAVVDTTAIPVATSAQAQMQPAVAAGGGNFLVTWHQYDTSFFESDVWSNVVSAAGAVADSEGLALTTRPGPQWRASAAYNGAYTLVAWDDSDGSGAGVGIKGRRVTSSGQVLDSADIVVDAGGHAYGPALTFNGSRFVVAYTDAAVANPGVRVRSLMGECGDGVVDLGEACDDDDVAAGDGCGATCAVEAGWSCDTLSPSLCTDVDECTATPGPCGAGTCLNEAGTYSCTCPAGYQDDGSTCVDVNECATGAAGCHANASCTNAAGSFSCACDVGYTGDGFSCAAACGDELVVGTEACDSGGVNTESCDRDCSAIACGDGLHNPEAGELCDDGNLDDGDGCSAACEEELEDGGPDGGEGDGGGGDGDGGDEPNVDAGPLPLDTDGDGIPDGEDTDSDGDGIADVDEYGDDNAATPPVDSDEDGIPDFQDTDSDGDGVRDADEAGDDDEATPPVDSDGDGTPDYLDEDSDDDGVPDAGDVCRVEPDPEQEDADGDGTGDACEAGEEGDGGPDAGDEDDGGPHGSHDDDGDDGDDVDDVEGGCDCNTGTGAGSGSWLLVALALLPLRRRRRAV